MAAGFVVVLAVLDDFGAQAAHGRDLVGIILGGDDEDAADAEEPAGVGQRLAVVAGRAADDAAAFLVVGESGNQIDAAADLERGRRRVVFMLEVVAAAEQLGQRRPLVQRRRLDVAAHDTRGRLDIFASGKLHVQVTRAGVDAAGA